MFGLLESTLGLGFFLVRGISRVEVSIFTEAIPSSVDVIVCDSWTTTPRTDWLRIALSDENSTCARKTVSRNMRRNASDSMLVVVVVVAAAALVLSLLLSLLSSLLVLVLIRGELTADHCLSFFCFVLLPSADRRGQIQDPGGLRGRDHPVPEGNQ